MADAARTPRPVQGAMGRWWRLVVAWIASPAVMGPICWRCRCQWGVGGEGGGDWEEVEEAEHAGDGGRRVAQGGREADAEHGDESEVEDRAGCGAERGCIEQRERCVAVGAGEAFAGQDEPPNEQGTSRATGGSRWQRSWLVFARSALRRFAADCHRLQPRGSIKAPSSVVRVATWRRRVKRGSCGARAALLAREGASRRDRCYVG